MSSSKSSYLNTCAEYYYWFNHNFWKKEKARTNVELQLYTDFFCKALEDQISDFKSSIFQRNTEITVYVHEDHDIIKSGHRAH